MVTFDSTLVGTTAETWSADTRLTSVAELSLDGVKNLIVVAAHPDDETLGAGGLIAECGSRGIPTLVVVVTDGAASHPDFANITPSELAARRAKEVKTAVGILSPTANVVLLGHADGRTREMRAAIARSLERAITATGSTALLASTWRGDGHRDHRVVGELCAELAEKQHLRFIEFPIWLWHWARPDDDELPYPRFARLPLTGTLREAKERAIAAHSTQVRSIGVSALAPPVLTPQFISHFTGSNEYFATEVTHG